MRLWADEQWAIFWATKIGAECAGTKLFTVFSVGTTLIFGCRAWQGRVGCTNYLRLTKQLFQHKIWMIQIPWWIWWSENLKKYESKDEHDFRPTTQLLEYKVWIPISKNSSPFLCIISLPCSSLLYILSYFANCTLWLPIP